MNITEQNDAHTKFTEAWLAIMACKGILRSLQEDHGFNYGWTDEEGSPMASLNQALDQLANDRKAMLSKSV